MNNLKDNSRGNFSQGKIVNEGSMNYDERRTIDMVHQLLSDSSNTYQEEKNMFDLLRVYGTILSRWTKNKDFPQSMMNSINALQQTFEGTNNKLMQLKNNDANSFIVKPLRGVGHRFATVIRKKDNDYSFTLVNKGLRPNYQFEEFIIPRQKLSALLSKLDIVNARIPTDKVYETLSQYADHRYLLNLKSTDQKTGNCFIKNPENAIKFAFSTKDYQKKDFEALRINDPLKAKTIKWGVTTVGLHRLFVEQLQREKPRISPALGQILQTYERNKVFRESIQQDPSSIMKSLYKAFDPYNELNKNSSQDFLKLLAQINTDTAISCKKELKNLLDKIDPKGNLSTKLNDMYKLKLIEYDNNYFSKENFGAIRTILEDAKRTFPVLANNEQRELHSKYISGSIGAYSDEKNIHKAIDYIEKSNMLYNYNAKTHYLEGLMYTTLGDNNKDFNANKSERNYLDAVDSFTTAIKLKEIEPAYYFQRGLAYHKLNKTWEATSDLNMANKLSAGMYPTSYNELKTNNNSENTLKKLIEELRSEIIEHSNKNIEKPLIERNQKSELFNLYTKNQHNKQINIGYNM